MDFVKPELDLGGNPEASFLDEPAFLSMASHVDAASDLQSKEIFLLPISFPKIFLFSFLGFASLFMGFCYVLRRYFLAHCSTGFRMNIAELLTSSTQALFASVAGIKITVQTWSDVVFAQSPITNVYAIIFIGYLVCDLFIMCAVQHRLGKTVFETIKSKLSMFFHHMLFICMVPPVSLYLRNGKGDHFIGCFLVMEVPVMFLHLHHALSAFKMKGTRIYLVNGIATMISYFLLRISIFPYMFYRLATRKAVSFWQIHNHVPRSCIIGSATCFAMQVYWFGLMVRKALRFSKGKDCIQDKDDQEVWDCEPLLKETIKED